MLKVQGFRVVLSFLGLAFFAGVLLGLRLLGYRRVVIDEGW